MSETIITVENLGKKYSIRHQKGERYTALRDVIMAPIYDTYAFCKSKAKRVFNYPGYHHAK